MKRSAFESVLMRWINLEPIIESEVSHKKKEKYCILIHIYGIQKDGNNNLTCGVGKETQVQRKTFGLSGRRQRWDDLRE